MSTNEYNREQKRLLQRQGTLDAEGHACCGSSPTERRPPAAPSRGGFHPRQFVDEVILELRKVMKPKRPELINYATVVFFTLAFVMSLVYALDYVYSLGAYAHCSSSPGTKPVSTPARQAPEVVMPEDPEAPASRRQSHRQVARLPRGSAATGGKLPPPASGDGQLVAVLTEGAEEVVAPPESPYDRPGRWYVVHTYAGLREQGQVQPREPDLLDEHGGPDLRGRHPARRRRRAEERQAPGRLPQGLPGLPHGPHGPRRRLLVRGAQHPRRYRLRRPGRPPDAAVAA